jgi:hypothetical protein
LVRVGDRRVTVRDFIQAFELAKTAYPQSADLGASGLQDASQKLLDEMATELVMLKRSDELGVSISEAELEDAVTAIKADYPPGVFEQTLIESAVSLETWKQRIRIRLLMETLVDRELRDQIVILPEDVETYYDRHYKGKAAGTDSDGTFQRLKEAIVAELRRTKMEEAYGAWISELKQKYPVEVNRKRFDQLVEGGLEGPVSHPETKTPAK